jgi:hypothetical protein
MVHKLLFFDSNFSTRTFNTNLALMLEEQCADSVISPPMLATSGDDVQAESHKKQKMEQPVHSTGSADQAEAAVEQPRHTQ